MSLAGRTVQSRTVGTITQTKSRQAAERRARRAAQARRRRSEDRADYDRAAKRLVDIDVGRVKPLSREEFLRALDLRG